MLPNVVKQRRKKADPLCNPYSTSLLSVPIGVLILDMRRTLATLALVTAVLGLAPAADGRGLFVLKGRGWGHGVGMSQWGAFGLAKNGTGYREILSHYYAGTTVATRPPRTVGVELTAGRRAVVIGSSAPFRVVAGARRVPHAAGGATVTKTATGRIRVQGLAGTFANPATFTATAPSGPLRLGSPHYRGSLVVSVKNGALRVVNRLGMDAYVRGVVPRESPSWWPAAALQAQAVAARSYEAFALAQGGGKCGGAFCRDTRDQVYGGLDGEAASTNAAVTGTAGEVVIDGGGNVAQTFFHSSSGGRTAASVDVWGGNISYLQSRADPRDLVAENPNRLWRVLITDRQLRRRLGLARVPTDAVALRNPSDRVRAIRASGPGWTTDVAAPSGGDGFRWLLGLKSNRFWLGVLRLTTSDSRIEFGQRPTLSALTRMVPGSVLKRRPHGGAWQDVRAVQGALNLRLSPRISTSYRLGPPAFGVGVRVSVEPNVLFAASQRPGGLAGAVRPELPGSKVSVQRRTPRGWRTVATAVVNANGTWRARFNVRPGTYRALSAPGRGYVPGTSPTLTIAVGN